MEGDQKRGRGNMKKAIGKEELTTILRREYGPLSQLQGRRSWKVLPAGNGWKPNLMLIEPELAEVFSLTPSQ